MTALRWRSVVSVLWLAVLGSVLHAETFTVGIVPQFEAKRLYAVWLPILDELGKRTGHEFTLLGSESIPAFERSFANGEFDLIYSNPWHAVIAHETQGYIPIIKDGARKLRGILVARKGGGITSVQQLEGQEIAFPAPNALGASLLMRADLSKLFHLTIKPVYVDTHTSVYLNVALGSTAAGGGVTRTLKEQQAELSDRLEVIYQTRAMEPHPISVHPRVASADRERITRAFIAMSAEPAFAALLNEVPIERAEATDFEDYAVLEEWGLREFYVTE